LRKPLVLASASPRRAALLRQVGIAAEVLPAELQEEAASPKDPDDYAEHLALAKARQVFRLRPEAIVVGADTLVLCDDLSLGKPGDEEDARRMLRLLAGRTHRVVTGLAVVAEVAGGVAERSTCVSTSVEFDHMSESEISDYVASGEAMDKAGAYAIQGRAAWFIRGIQGSYSNVVGLPLNRLRCLLQEMGLEPTRPSNNA